MPMISAMPNREYASVQCLDCGKILVSRDWHNPLVCGCPQATCVEVGPIYLLCSGRDLRRVRVLNDPYWPADIRLETLQAASALCLAWGARFMPDRNATQADIDAALAWLESRTRQNVAASERSGTITLHNTIGWGMPIESLPAEFKTWVQKRVERRPSVAGGEAVFMGTRLTIGNIAGMCEAGEPLANILEDYPYLTREDVENARALWQLQRGGAALSHRWNSGCIASARKHPAR
jgi:uncharacterized protein (DUF433 family)